MHEHCVEESVPLEERPVLGEGTAVRNLGGDLHSADPRGLSLRVALAVLQPLSETPTQEEEDS